MGKATDTEKAEQPTIGAAADAAMAVPAEGAPVDLKAQVTAILNDVLPDMVASLIAPEAANEADAKAKAEADAKAEAKRFADAAKAAEIEGKRLAKEREARLEAAAIAHTDALGGGPPTASAARLASMAQNSEGCRILFSNGQAFCTDFSFDAAGKLAMLGNFLTITEDIIPPANVPPFTAMSAVLMCEGEAVALSVIGAGATFGGGAELRLPGKSLAFWPGADSVSADAA